MNEEQENFDLFIERNNLVVKSNTIIQKSRYKLSAQEQKLLLFIISKIKPTDKEFKSIVLSLKQICKVCGITYNSKNYINFRNSISSLSDKGFWIDTGKQELFCRWVHPICIDKERNTIEIRLDDNLLPYLIELRNNFTAFELENVLLFQSKYSIRLYEILKSYAHKGEIVLSLGELRKLLGLTPEQYKEYKEFNRNVLSVAVKEIKDYSDLWVEAKPIRINRKIVEICFEINIKDIALKTYAQEDRQYILGGIEKYKE